MTQFSRSLHAECWNAGVDVHVVTPFYIVSNLFKRKSGTIIAPMPIALIRGTLAQLGKKYVWQVRRNNNIDTYVTSPHRFLLIAVSRILVPRLHRFHVARAVDHGGALPQDDV